MGLWLLILIVKGATLFNSLDYCLQGTNLFSLIRQKESVAEIIRLWWVTKWVAKLLLVLLFWEHLHDCKFFTVDLTFKVKLKW